jgi:hypothetical protein
MKKISIALVLAAIFFGLQLSSRAQSSEPSLAQIPLPPMGWSSWNSFSNTVNSANTIGQADALHTSSLQKAGYEYVNIDEGWWLGDRDEMRNIVVDPKAWPAILPGDRDGDMTNIVRYIHSLGLKAGIYTDAGKDGCSMYPDIGPAYFHTGSEGHYEQDFLQFAKWGFDYVKVDWCGGDRENLDPNKQYGEIARAIARAAKITGHRLYFSICEWGKQSPFTWAAGVGDAEQAIWRTGDDIVAPVVAKGPHTERKVSLENMFKNFDKNYHPEAQHTGYYNDPDMMVLGMPGLNAAQNRLHMALWAIAGAPLLIGADMSKLDAETLADFTNPDIIAIDQDPAGLQGVKVKENGPGLEVWSKFLSHNGERAVLLFNRTYFPAPMSVKWADLGFSGDVASVHEVWTVRDPGAVKDQYDVTVPPQNAVLLLVQGTEGEFAHYLPVSETQNVGASETLFADVSAVSSSWSQLRINYRNTSAETRIVDLYVNGQTGTRVALPASEGKSRSVLIQVQLDQSGKHNMLNFSGQADVKIESIDVHHQTM